MSITTRVLGHGNRTNNMATLIRVKFGNKKIRRCDARCYNAVGEKCKCVCNGKNHGGGIIAAIDKMNTVKKHVNKQYKHATATYTTMIPAMQLDLFK